MPSKEVSIRTADNSLLRGHIFNPSEAKKSPAILFIHGWASDERGYLPRAERLEAMGYASLTFNLRGHGSSDGKLGDLKLSDHMIDAQNAYDFLAAQKFVDKNMIHLVGASYGGYLSAMLSSVRPAKSLVLRAPALYRDSDAERTERQRATSRKKDGEFSTKVLDAVSRFDGPILVVSSEFDAIIPPAVISAYMLAAKMPTHITIDDADHGLSKPEWREEFLDLLVEWFGKQL